MAHTGYQDATLLEDFFLGKKQAFDEIFERFHDRIYYFCFKIIGDPEESRDITVQAFTRLFQKHTQKFASLDHIKNSLMISSRNSCADYLRSIRCRMDRQKRPLDSLMDETAIASDTLDFEYLFHHIESSLGSLPDRQKNAIYLIYFKSLKYREAAVLMGISPQAVSNLCSQGVANLRKMLRNRKVDEAILIALLLVAIPF